MNPVRCRILAVLAASLAASVAAGADAGDSQGAGAFSSLQGVALEDLVATRTNPLFSPSRQAPAPPAEPPPETAVAEPIAEPDTVPEEPPQLSLVGVVIAGGEKYAILRDERTGETRRLRSGEAMEGWTFTVLDPLNVSLENGGDRRVRRLFDKDGQALKAGDRAEAPDEQDSAGLWR